MKKIALICNTYIRNYGSILQSYATFYVLRQLGYDVEVVNYKDTPDKWAKMQILCYIKLPMLFNYNIVIKKLDSLLASKKDDGYSKMKEKRVMAMESFVLKNFHFTSEYYSKKEIKNGLMDKSAVIIGSDQLWGPADIIRDYHTLNFVPEMIPKISYATSFGVSSLPYYVRKRTSDFLRKIDFISVREDTGALIIKHLIQKDVKIVVDPTLLLNAEDWMKIQTNEPPIHDRYIFCFFLGNNPEQRSLVKKVSYFTKLPIVSMQHLDEYIKSDIEFADQNVNDATPDTFINLIRNAEYIFCDSFHASVFSIIYHKNFFTFNRYNSKFVNSRNSRIDSLFNHLGLQQRHIEETENVCDFLKKSIDYENVDKKLDLWRRESLDFLKKSLSHIVDKGDD